MSSPLRTETTVPARPATPACLPPADASAAPPFVSATLIDDGLAVAFDGADGARVRFHALWLRENALDERTREPGSGQRRITARDVPADTRLLSARLEAGGVVHLLFAPDRCEIRFTAAWLAAHAYDVAEGRGRGWTASHATTWDCGLRAALPEDDFAAVHREGKTFARWLAAIRRYGFARLTGGPVESGALLGVAALFGYVRETHYGRMFEVRTEVNPSNLAYTPLGLQAHTDNPYRDPTPSMQILYCLENSAEGGDSMVVDGFRVVERLREESAEVFELLARHCARFEYAGSPGVRLQTRRPIIELAPDGEIIAVRFNNRSIAPVTDVPFDLMPAWQAAYRRFSELVDEPSMAVSFKLAPGECFVLDNRRVLHARTAYSGTGTRWLQGCYPDIDGLLSTLAAIEQRTGERF